jgi:hypothetical protein
LIKLSSLFVIAPPPRPTLQALLDQPAHLGALDPQLFRHVVAQLHFGLALLAVVNDERLVGILLLAVDVVQRTVQDVLGTLLGRSQHQQNDRREQDVVVELWVVVAEEVGVAQPRTAHVHVDAALKQLLGEVKVHELAVVVQVVGAFAARLRRVLAKVLEIHRGAFVHFRADDDDASVVPLDVVEQQVRQQERPDVVGAGVQLDAIDRRLIRLHRETGIVDEALKLWHLLLDFLGEIADRLEAGEVQLHRNHLAILRLGLDLLDGLVGFCEVATGENDGRSSFGESSCDFVAESGVGAGDNEDFALEIVLCVDPA